MPLLPGKKNQGHNIRTEMEHGKPQKQAIAISYAVMRKGKKKKMAEGGSVSAKTEKRPMPDQSTDSKAMVSRNSGDKAPKHDSWTDRSTETQAQSNSGRMVKPIKRARMVPSDAFSTRLYDEEGMLQQSAKPGSPDEQPPKHDDEEGPDRQGPKVRDMQDEHSTHRKPYAKGGEVESSDYKHPENKYEQDLTHLTPSEDEGQEMAVSHDEMDADMEGKGPDMEEPHNEDQRKAYARGGEVSPEDEEQEEHHNSIAAAIMARRERLHAEIDSGAHDMDEAVRMAEGGEILDHEDANDIHSHDSIYSDDSDQADLSRNADEDANEEDQLSYNALRKENYNESESLRKLDSPRDSAQKGDDREEDSENEHDMIGSIRRKMNMKRQFGR